LRSKSFSLFPVSGWENVGLRTVSVRTSIPECYSKNRSFRTEEMVISNLLKVRVTLIGDIQGNVPTKRFYREKNDSAPSHFLREVPRASLAIAGAPNEF